MKIKNSLFESQTLTEASKSEIISETTTFVGIKEVMMCPIDHFNYRHKLCSVTTIN